MAIINQNVNPDQVIRYLREKDANGAFQNYITWIGAEQRYVNSMRQSNVNNLEEQLIIGTDTYTIFDEDEDFKLHPIFKEYAYLFKLKDVENVSLNYDKTIVSDYKIFITDFSSFQFDFVKIKRPIIYFLPDMKEFKAGLHSYRNLDLKYEDAFGKLCLDSDELIKEMNKITKNNYKPEKKYIDRMDKFFLEIKNPTDKIYKDIKEL